MRAKKLNPTSLTAKSKKRKSASPTPTSNTELLSDCHQHRAGLTTEEKAFIDRETDAARAAGGSRLAAAKHLLIVRRFLVGDATNPKQKKLWSAYLAANLPGFCISRSQVFKDMKAAEIAEEIFPAAFLNEFVTGGYALNLRPTVEEPLGKFTEPCQQILAKLKSEELNAVQFRTVLSEAASIVKENAKKNRAPRASESADEKRARIMKAIHEAILDGLEDLALAIEEGDEYPTSNGRDELEEIVGRLLTATEIETLDLGQRRLPEGYRSLNLPAPAPKPLKTETRSSRSEARVAKAAKREPLLTAGTVACNGTIPVSSVMALEVSSAA
jgi:hypothetical protein